MNIIKPPRFLNPTRSSTLAQQDPTCKPGITPRNNQNHTRKQPEAQEQPNLGGGSP